jgi:hypothetical protein
VNFNAALPTNDDYQFLGKKEKEKEKEKENRRKDKKRIKLLFLYFGGFLINLLLIPL